MHVRGSGSIIVGSNSFNQTPTVVTGSNYDCQPGSPNSFNQTPTVVTGLGYECQPGSPNSFNQTPTVVTGLGYDCQAGSPNSFNQTPTVVTGLGYECQPDLPTSFDSFIDTATSSSIFQSYALSENAFENVNDDFVTLEQFLKEETTFESFESFLRSDQETAFQIIADYFPRYASTPKRYLEPIQSILLVILVVSIFSQQFGGNRSLPVA